MAGFERLMESVQKAAKEIETLCAMMELANRRSDVGRQKWRSPKRGKTKKVLRRSRRKFK